MVLILLKNIDSGSLLLKMTGKTGPLLRKCGRPNSYLVSLKFCLGHPY